MATFKKHNYDLKTSSGFEKIYMDYASKMFYVGITKIDDPEKLKGIIQEIFIALWERRNELHIKGAIEHYLMRALKYKIIDYYRSKTRKKKGLERISTTISEIDFSTENDIAYSALCEEIEQITAKLSRQTQKAFRLSKIEGMTNKEVANVLSISERAVAYHLAKVNDRLKKLLITYY
ncbi:sigma-70 family RNA polymerase sigma factor [Aquimarina longa]|uniref:sigma-70 family RNA polymerase sigma factor n=1 Tax=Aquimarina longa TaxID=1080221 RepID=UPI0007820B3F|nr:sigma-70 family RNA polymerase sigma factor [Aquimarina longa]